MRATPGACAHGYSDAYDLKVLLGSACRFRNNDPQLGWPTRAAGEGRASMTRSVFLPSRPSPAGVQYSLALILLTTEAAVAIVLLALVGALACSFFGVCAALRPKR
jgi:hypothetical protein